MQLFCSRLEASCLQLSKTFFAYRQLCLGAFLLKIYACLVTVELLCLQEESVSKKPLNRL